MKKAPLEPTRRFEIEVAAAMIVSTLLWFALRAL